MKRTTWIKLFFWGSLAFSGATLSLFFSDWLQLKKLDVPQVKYSDNTTFLYDYMEPNKNVPFNLVDPETAPPSIRDQVMLGFKIVSETQKYAYNYAFDAITCNNCHFCGGNTLGGKNGGISLVGVTKMYPQYSARDNKTITLRQRINNCFKRSLNGRPLPEDSPEMDALIAYLEWISHEVTKFPEHPWLGLPFIKTDHVPSTKNGAHLFDKCCSLCHGNQGQGGAGAPPLWGPYSFNDGAGMDQMSKLTSFIFLNMPHGNPYLTLEEANDIAGFIISQPRPIFHEKNI